MSNDEIQDGSGLFDSPLRVLDAFFSFTLVALILLGLFHLYVASLFAVSYMWGEEIWPGIIADYWGVRVYDRFYWYLNGAISLLAVASILFVVRIALDVRNASYTKSRSATWHLRLGLMLPSIVTWGVPLGIFYGGSQPGFNLTGLISPFYSFAFTGMYGYDASFILTTSPSPFYVLGVIQLVLAVSQYVALRGYEAHRIGLGLLLIPVLASLIQSVLLISFGVPQFLYSIQDLVQVSLPIPVFTIGVLLRASARPVQD